MTTKTEANNVIVNGIEIPPHVAIIRGYLEGQSATVVATQEIGLYGYQWVKERSPGDALCGPWVVLPAVNVTVVSEKGTVQSYTVARNDDGIVSPHLFGPMLAEEN